VRLAALTPFLTRCCEYKRPNQVADAPRLCSVPLSASRLDGYSLRPGRNVRALSARPFYF
jgi:hypothetical protein